MAISTIGTDALASAAVTSAKLASGAPSRSQLPAGTVLQVVSYTYANTSSTSSTTPVATPATVSITPTSATSKILVEVDVGASACYTTDYGTFFYLYKNGSAVAGAQGASAGSRTRCWMASRSSNYARYQSSSGSYVDSPATTSAITYTLYWSMESGGGTSYLNYSSSDSASQPSAVTTITLTEIAV